MVGARIYVLAAALVGMLMMAGCGASTSPNTVTATPSFSPAGGNFNSSQVVTITDTTSGAVLYCTTDGTTPTTSSPQCSQPTTVFKSEYLQAIALAPGKTASAVAAAGYTINLPAAATPTFSPAGGTYAGTQTISIADATTGANIFYTTDGTVPSTSSSTSSTLLYSGPITISKTQTVSAIAIASGFSNSGVASATYTINLLAATPAFSAVARSASTPTPRSSRSSCAPIRDTASKTAHLCINAQDSAMDRRLTRSRPSKCVLQQNKHQRIPFAANAR